MWIQAHKVIKGQMDGKQQAASGEITKYTQAQQTTEKLIRTQLRSMKGRFSASMALLSTALLLTGKASRSLTLMSYVRTCPMLQSTQRRPNHLSIHSTPSLCSTIPYVAASPITPRQARQSGDDTDSGCGQTPAGRDGRDGLPGPPGPQGLAGTTTDH